MAQVIALLICFTTSDKAEANVTEYICNCCYTTFPQREVADVKGFECLCLYLASVIKYPDICLLVSLKSIDLIYPLILSSLGKDFSCYLFTYCIIYFFPHGLGVGCWAWHLLRASSDLDAFSSLSAFNLHVFVY